MSTTPFLFDANGLAQIQRVNDEIKRNTRKGLRDDRTLPLLDAAEDDNDWSISDGGSRVGTVTIR